MRVVPVIVLLILTLLVPPAFAASTHQFFRSYDCTSATYVYDDTGEAVPANAELMIHRYSRIDVEFYPQTLNSTSVTFQILVRSMQPDGGVVWAEAFTKQYTAATTHAERITISEIVDFMAIGILVAGNVAGDVFSVKAIWR